MKVTKKTKKKLRKYMRKINDENNMNENVFLNQIDKTSNLFNNLKNIRK